MSDSVAITPSGRLWLDDDPDWSTELPLASRQRLAAAFAESSAAGLLCLASTELNVELTPPLTYWRTFATQLLETLRQLGETSLEKWRELPDPSDDEFATIVSAAPPMRGLDNLTPTLLRSLWNELRSCFADRAANAPEGADAFWQSLNPAWHSLGRVTFHLAENKRNPERPFAFLATFAHRLSSRAKVQHLPLAEAVQRYAAAHDQPKLATLLEPVRRAAERCEFVRNLLTSRALFQPQAWSARDAYRFLREAPQMQEAGIAVRLPDWWNPRQPPRPHVEVTIGQSSAGSFDAGSLLDFRVEVALDGEPLTAAEREHLLAAADELVLLRGRWVEANGEQLREALEQWRRVKDSSPDGIDILAGMRMLAGVAIRDRDASPATVTAWSRITAGEWLTQTLERLRNPGEVAGCEPGRDLRATLRPYQADGVRWLWFLSNLTLGACLADDMGLGKTIQVLDLLLQLRRASIGLDATRASTSASPSASSSSVDMPRTSLLVVPASLIGNWKQELERFAPDLRAFFAHRSECDAEAMRRLCESPGEQLRDHDLLVTTYGFVRSNPWMAERSWRLVILDEAQAIKNADSDQTRAVKRLRATSRIALSGTPVENHLGDLWSIFDFCCPGLLGTGADFKRFVKRTTEQAGTESLAALRRLVRPYILRRLKSDPRIAPDLPEKTEMRADCSLAKRQAALYERAVAELARRLESAEGMARRGLVLATLTQLKQICNHPAQLLGNNEYRPEDSGKFLRLAELCRSISERQERALVFTQFQSLTEPLADFLQDVFGRRGLVLHGGTPVGKRKQLVREFQDEQGPPYFVISLKAGGSGLNLTAASHVIHFDRWWNPAVENQATDRAFRIGQRRNVLVHKFVCRGTVEERIDEMIRNKQHLAGEILAADDGPLLTEWSDRELLDFVSLDLNRAMA